MNLFKLLLLAFTAFFIASANAGAPLSIKYVEEIITSGDNIYAHYIVTCSDGKRVDISGWNDGKKWCVGKGRQDRCAKKRIQIAKRACGRSK